MHKDELSRKLKYNRIFSSVMFPLAVVVYVLAGYANGHFSTDEYSETFFRNIYFGSMLVSFIAVCAMMYHATRQISSQERAILVILILVGIVMTFQAGAGGLLVGAFTNF